jgi:hypothetical protein
MRENVSKWAIFIAEKSYRISTKFRKDEDQKIFLLKNLLTYPYFKLIINNPWIKSINLLILN